MRIRAAAAVCAAFLAAALTGAACGGGSFFRQYEYEEEMYLSLDGSATVYVNSSIVALDVLRGASLDASPSARFDAAAVRDFFSSPVTHVTRVSSTRRGGRQFAHVRMDVDDIRRLAEAKPFAWSSYQFGREGNLFVYRQTVGAPAATHADLAAGAGWNGSEMIAFRLHIPSKIAYHNTRPDDLRRGNILVWEQPLAERLRGVPLSLDARMETQSILYRTLWLFGATILAVAVVFAVVILWVLRRGGRAPRAQGQES